jgi:glycosyltransferase involved in cell wall biosynthesis
MWVDHGLPPVARLLVMQDSPRIPVLLMARELNQGGCERDLARLALGFREGPFEPHVACFRSGGMRYDEVNSAGIPVCNLDMRGFRSPSALTAAFRLAGYVRLHGIQLVHAMDVPTAAFATPICRVAGTPAILSCQLSYRGMYGRGERMLMGWADRLADRVVGNCQAVLDDLIENYGVRRHKAALIYNGVELDRFRPPAHGRERAVLPEGFRCANVVIGTVCALRPEKRVDVLIRAFAQLDPGTTNVRLVCVGSGALDAEWKALAAALGVAGQVHFEPATPDVELWMRGFDVYTLPSELESFPNGLLEAMACGCAVVASNVGGVPEMVGEAGMLIPPGDPEALAAALRELQVDSRRRADLGAAAAKRVAERFSVANNLRTTAALYAETLAAKGLRVPRRQFDSV